MAESDFILLFSLLVCLLVRLLAYIIYIIYIVYLIFFANTVYACNTQACI